MKDGPMEIRVVERGLVGWAAAAWARMRLGAAGAGVKRHLQLVETMPIGAKKQLLLVSCDGERFLVGVGAECVQTMVRVQGLSTEEGL